MIRAIRLELAKPLGADSWDSFGPVLRLLAKATPKLLNAAYDARIAIQIAGRDAVKAKVGPAVEAKSGEGLCYQAVLRKIEDLRAWGAKKLPLAEAALVRAEKQLVAIGVVDAEERARAERSVEGARHQRDEMRGWAGLSIPGGMSSAISKAAVHAFGRRDQGRVTFHSERILIRAQEVSIIREKRGFVLGLGLRSKGRVQFAVARSWGAHANTLDAIVQAIPYVKADRERWRLQNPSRKRKPGAVKLESQPHRPHLPYEFGDCKLQRDKRSGKWYALLSYEAPEPVAVAIDAAKVLAVHRGARNALYLLSTTGGRAIPLPGGKFLAQRRALRARMREIQHITTHELGTGAKGRGRSRRFERYSQFEDKLARVTHTFCQQAAAVVYETAARLGCGLVLIEDYGGIEPDDDAAIRRVLDHGPLYALKQATMHRLEKGGIALKEVSSEFISSRCPRCDTLDPRAHNVRTGIFHCRVCVFERPADWVAAFWMLSRGTLPDGSLVDMSTLRERLRRERELADALRKKKTTEDADEAAE